VHGGNHPPHGAARHGADPLQAVRLRVVVVFMLLAAVSLTATRASLLTPGRLVSAQQQLRRPEP